MVRHVVRMTAASLLVTGCMFLPFLPGASDRLAMTLSGMAQIFGIAGLVLVPIGAAWLGYELRSRAAHAAAPRGRDAGWWFALAAIVAATLVALVVSVPALAEIGSSLGLALLAAWAYWALRCHRRRAISLRTERRRPQQYRQNALPFLPSPVYSTRRSHPRDPNMSHAATTSAAADNPSTTTSSQQRTGV